MWKTLVVPRSELCLDTTLKCGQSFRWKKTADNEWTTTLKGRIVSLRQNVDSIQYQSIFPKAPVEDDTHIILHDYFQLKIKLRELYQYWSTRDPNFQNKSLKFAGVRILRQDCWENVVSFICSSNNNIPRISLMIDRLCSKYGTYLGTASDFQFYSFPDVSSLIGSSVENELRTMGFGYRAKYISKTAQLIAQKPPGWLESLRHSDYKEAKESLLELSGVGPKVADCVCLMSMDKPGSIPVDTHVWQIAQRDYQFRVKAKTMSAATYDAVGDFFRDLWGEYAGWAHSVLFTADLKGFKERLIDIKTEKVKVIKMEDGDLSLTKDIMVNTTKQVLTDETKEIVNRSESPKKKRKQSEEHRAEKKQKINRT
ncbi:N-glycosylase/DNA lyase [Neolecta irregularis DAH-3]|uniref:N-glycosylase/DNA lyase n=1 Tax=Neolecta irregularis (strain DAH-3) TaxID=1198029 RepID=A0A1U7LRK4_NEOID|nr:N-glycosylase/DNA lyase [Neolecta irregularis DAH-3]|eukprot:OLL25259.1 N-glycosylase/DNA lyase [Neolecta irregularis DAH-3]